MLFPKFPCYQIGGNLEVSEHFFFSSQQNSFWKSQISESCQKNGQFIILSLVTFAYVPAENHSYIKRIYIYRFAYRVSHSMMPTAEIWSIVFACVSIENKVKMLKGNKSKMCCNILSFGPNKPTILIFNDTLVCTSRAWASC